MQVEAGRGPGEGPTVLGGPVWVHVWVWAGGGHLIVRRLTAALSCPGFGMEAHR